MDIATIIGIAAAFGFIMVGVGSNLGAMLNGPSAIIVIGGTIASALIMNPLSEVINLIGVYKKSFVNTILVPTELIERIY